jgi:NADH-quinone oxidoreductase subunit L
LALAAGAVIVSVHHEQDIFRMGGLRRPLPLTFWTFLIGAAALSGLPLITSGFYSKDWILWSAWSSPIGGPWLWLGGAAGALLTGLYSFRLIFRVFFGDIRTVPGHGPGAAMSLPLVVLAVLSLGIGFLEIPGTLGDLTWFSSYLSHALPVLAVSSGAHESEAVEQLAVSLASVLGIALAALLFLPRLSPADRLAGQGWWRTVENMSLNGWGFDRLYQRLLVEPWQFLTRDAGDVTDRAYTELARAACWSHMSLSRTQTGRVRWYAATLATAALLLIGWFAL